MKSAKDIATAIFICDASTKMGTGHVRRCELLAKQLAISGLGIKFLYQEMPEFWIDRLKQDGFQTECLSNNSKAEIISILKNVSDRNNKQSIVIVDSYDPSLHNLDFQNKIVGLGLKLMYFIFKTANSYKAHLMLNQNILATSFNYDVEDYTDLMLGTQYVLLKDEYRQIQKEIKPYALKDEVLLLFFGGSDPFGRTLQILKLLTFAKFEKIYVVTGKLNKDNLGIKELIKEIENAELYIETEKLAELMGQAKYSINSGGLCLWELAVSNCLQIVIPNSPIEKETSEYCQENNYIHLLDENTSFANQMEIIEKALKDDANKEKVERFRNAVAVDGLQKVTDKILNLIGEN